MVLNDLCLPPHVLDTPVMATRRHSSEPGPAIAAGAIVLNAAWLLLLVVLYVWDRQNCTPETCEDQATRDGFMFVIWFVTQVAQSLYVVPCAIWLIGRWRSGKRGPEGLGIAAFCVVIALGIFFVSLAS